jgi:hypothetical protein
MLHYLIPFLAMLGPALFFGIGQGPSGGEETTAGNLTNTSTAATGLGLGDLSTASNFWDTILSGNQQNISALLGPEFGAISGQAQQNIDTTGQFGNRSGGTNAAIQNTTNSVRGADTSLIDQLTAAAPTALANIGSGTLSTGVGAEEGAFSAQNTLQQQTANQWNDIFNSITSLAAAPFTGGASLANMFEQNNNTNAANLDASASGGYNSNNVANNDVALPALNLPGTPGYDPTVWQN